MELCSHGHDEVCHDSRSCPLCEAKDTIRGLEQIVKDLEQEVKDLN